MSGELWMGETLKEQAGMISILIIAIAFASGTIISWVVSKDPGAVMLVAGICYGPLWCGLAMALERFALTIQKSVKMVDEDV